MGYFMALLLVAQVALWRLPFLGRILTSDPSIFAYISDRILHGEVLYRDLLDNKTPLIYYAGALFIRLFSDPSLGYWIMEAAFEAVTALAIYFHIRRDLPDVVAAVVVSLGIILANVSMYYYFTPGFVEYLSTMFVTVAYLITLRSTAAWAHMFAGLAVFLAFSAQQLAVISCLPILFWLLRERRYRLLSIQAASFIVPLAATAYWFHSRGALNDLLYASLYYNVFYINSNPNTIYWFRIRQLLYLLPPILFVALRMGKWPITREAQLALLWLLAAAASLTLTGTRLYAHYFVLLVPPLILLLAHAVRATEWRRQARGTLTWLLLFGCVLAYSCYPYFDRVHARLQTDSANAFENPYLPLAAWLPDYPFSDPHRTVLYLGVFNPTEPALLFNTRLPGRFTLDYTYFDVVHPMRAAMRDEWVRSVTDSQPELIVIMNGFDFETKLPGEMIRWISENYSPYRYAKPFTILKRLP